MTTRVSKYNELLDVWYTLRMPCSVSNWDSTGFRAVLPCVFLAGKNPMDRIAWLATVHRVAESDMTEHAWTLCICYICCRRNLCFLHTYPRENKAVRDETAKRDTWYCRTNCLSSWTLSSLNGTVQYALLTATALLLNAATEHLQFSCFSFFFFLTSCYFWFCFLPCMEGMAFHRQFLSIRTWQPFKVHWVQSLVHQILLTVDLSSLELMEAAFLHLILVTL